MKLFKPREKLAQSNKRNRQVSFQTKDSESICSNDESMINGSLHNSITASRPHLHLQYMRTHKKRDPFEYYEVLQMLGDGSMGSVCKVKKRKSAIGGSARKAFVDGRKRSNLLTMMPCLSFCLLGNDVEEETKNGALVAGEESFEDEFEDDPKFREIGAIDKASDAVVSSVNSSIVSYSGTYGVVYALKSIILDQVSNETFVKELQNEIEILKTLDHPNICKAIETFEFKKQLYLVLELCSGGDLYTRDPYDEKQARHIVHSILDACTFLHRKHITHRDLKYENIMFASPTSPTVKIIDFGLSKKYSHKQNMSQTVGTIYTMAPEVIKGKYGEKCDVWSIGVLAYMLLSSSIPFFGKERRHVIKRILKGKYHFKARRWWTVSKEAKKFVTSLLVLDEKRRPSCSDALNHKWFRDYSNSSDCGSFVVSSAVMDRVQATIQTYAGYTKLKKLALFVIARKSSADEVGFLQQIFRNRFDTEKDGIITLKEFKEALSVYSYTDEELETMFEAIDIDGTERLAYSEFLAATIEAHGSIEEDRIAEAFDRLDSDDTGYITVKNLAEFLGKDVPKEFIDDIIREADIVTKDHRIDYEEFLGLWDGDFNQVMAENLKEVRKKRSIRDGKLTDRSFDEGEDGTFLLESKSGEEEKADIDDSTGKYFYEQEKEKSLRAEWF